MKYSESIRTFLPAILFLLLTIYLIASDSSVVGPY